DSLNQTTRPMGIPIRFNQLGSRSSVALPCEPITAEQLSTRQQYLADLPYLMSDAEAAAFLNISRATFWRRVKDGTFPKPIKIGAATRWKTAVLIDAVDRASSGSEV
ncbi:MAG: AlpA family phage regulatory protein, partial [Pseudomonadota bacterium]